MEDERRAFYRVLMRTPLSCLAVHEDGTAQLMRMETIDLSVGGGKAYCPVPPVAGAELRLIIALGGEDGSLRLDATVVRVEPGVDDEGGVRVGLAFTPLSNSTEQRLMHAVFAQERHHADRHAHVRSSIWHPLTLELEGESHPGHAEALSTDDIQLVTRAPLAESGRVQVALSYPAADLELHAAATVVSLEQEGAAVRATLRFDQLDRLTHSRILRMLIEDERRTISGS